MVSVEPVAEEAGTLRPAGHAAAAAAASPIFTINALQTLSERIHRADSLETLVDSILLALEETFGFSHSMFLVPAEEKDVLVTIATRGYSENGAGAEVRFGEGICGMVAEARKPIRISGLMRGMLYALAMHRAGAASRACRPPHSSCRACPIRRASSACRCSCAASWSASCASRARCRIASMKRIARRSSFSAATWPSPCRT